MNTLDPTSTPAIASARSPDPLATPEAPSKATADSSPLSGSTTTRDSRSGAFCQHCGEPAQEGEHVSKTHRKITEAEAEALRKNGYKRTFRGYAVKPGLLFCWPCKNFARHDGILRDVMGRQMLRDMTVTLAEAGFKKADIARVLGIGRRSVYNYLGDVWPRPQS